MNEIRLITKDDIATLKYEKIDWDVVVKGVPYQIIRVKDYVHTIGGRLDNGDGNCLWAYPLNEELCYENLREFDGVPGARWGIEYNPTNYLKCKWDEPSIECGRKLIITRNDEPFYDGFMTIHEALAYVLDNKLDDHPLNLNMRDFDKKCIGRKVWWRSEPAIITSYIHKQACVILEPDGMKEFSIPAEYKDDDFTPSDERDSIKSSIFDNHIWWFRD